MKRTPLLIVALTCLIARPAIAQSLRDVVKDSEGGRMPSRAEWQQRHFAENGATPTPAPNLEPGPAEHPPAPMSPGLTTPTSAGCAPPGMPALSDLVSVGHQVLVAPVEGSDETVMVSAIGLITRDHLARYRAGDVPPDFIAYYVHGYLAAVDDHPGDPAEPDLVDTGMVSPRGAALARGTPVCQWVRLPRPVDDSRSGTPNTRI